MSKAVSKKGKVWLAGAGPGDAGLLTVKAKALIESVDVIVYDALVSTEVISQIPKEKEMIYVGKRSGNHPIPQDKINEILLSEARKGKKVLRLKGGDPFVFGRGGEELELLTEFHIPFEVVPGVTSAAAAPAYAGIPLTHRDYTSSFHIITGHPRKDGVNRINYPALVGMDATLVFLMGISAMEDICNGLLDAGMNADMPAAIVEKGTTSAQRRVISTVGRLFEDAQAAAIGTPAIILVGRVCSLGERFSWAEERILGGRQILITRSREKGSVLAGRLRELGAQVIELPSIVTKPITPRKQFQKALENFGTQTEEAWFIFTSPVGVEVFFNQLSQLKIDIRSLLKRKADIKFGVIGSATAKELNGYGIFADIMPDNYCAAELGLKLAAEAKSGSQILIARAREGSAELVPPLSDAGLLVEDIPIYETVYETHEQIREIIQGIFSAGEIDAVTFTSASTVHGFAQTMKDLDFSKVKAVCIGEQTAHAAKEYQMQTVTADKAAIESMIDKMIEIYGK